MATLENIIQNCGVMKEGLTHKKQFLNQKSTTRGSWKNRRRFEMIY